MLCGGLAWMISRISQMQDSLIEVRPKRVDLLHCGRRVLARLMLGFQLASVHISAPDLCLMISEYREMIRFFERFNVCYNLKLATESHRFVFRDCYLFTGRQLGRSAVQAQPLQAGRDQSRRRQRQRQQQQRLGGRY